MHSTGKVAGVFSLVGVAVAALIGLAVWAVYRRRRHADSVPVGSVAGGDTPQRRPSRLSEMILAGGTTRSSVHGIQTAGLESGDHGETTADITPVTPRASYPCIVDQRLNPDDSLWEPLRRHNGSHASLHSLQDNRDYSRRMFRVSLHGESRKLKADENSGYKPGRLTSVQHPAIPKTANTKGGCSRSPRPGHVRLLIRLDAAHPPRSRNTQANRVFRVVFIFSFFQFDFDQSLIPSIHCL